MRFVSNVVLCASALVLPLKANAQSVWTAEPLVRVQPTSPPGTSTGAVVKAARNEYEGTQIVVRAPDSGALSGVNVAASDLVGPGTIAKSNIRLYRAQYISVTKRSSYEQWQAPNPPGDWADALIPADVPGGTYPSFPFSVPAGRNQPVYVEVYVPRGTPPGTYTGTISVTAAGQSPRTLPLILAVWDFTLPDKPTIASEFWQNDLWMNVAATKVPGAARAALLANITNDLRRHRVGVGVTNAPDAGTDTILQQQPRIGVTWGLTDTTLQEIVKAYGPARLYAQHRDEPQTRATINEINDPNGEVQRYRRNGVPELLTLAWSPERINGEYVGWAGDVDIFVPNHSSLIPFTNAQQKLNAGKEVWSYTVGINQNEAPTWLLDYDLIHYRIVPWLDYSTNLTGFLYFMPTNWCAGDPWTNIFVRDVSCAPEHSFNLEGVFYFPGHKVGAPNAAIPSARLKAIRDGVEDHDYLALLASRGDPTLAKTLAKTLAPAWDNWSRDPAALVAAREQAAARIVQLVSGGDAGVDGGEVDGGDPRGDAGDRDAGSSPGADDDGAGRQAPFVACSCRMAGAGRPPFAVVSLLLVLAVGGRRRATTRPKQ